MAGKKQHYVPQFLLRQFALDGLKDKIALFRLSNHKFIPQTTIRDQAHENHFYGNSPLEDSLAELEGYAARYITEAIERGTLPVYLSEGYHVLQLFTILQSYRTRHAADETNEKVDKLWKMMLADHPELKEHLDKFTVQVENAPAINVEIAALEAHVANDLRFKLLINRTQTPFVISDHPAVRYNQFLETRKPTGGITGLAVKGLQIFLPISPRHTIIFFDAWAYKVGGRKLTSLAVEVAELADVHALNLLQAVSADNHLFANGLIQQGDLRLLAQRAAKYRLPDKVSIEEHPQHGTMLRNSLVHIHRHDLRLGLKLKFITIQPQAQRYEMGNRMLHVRDQTLYDLNKEFVRLVRLKQYRADEWNRFLQEAPLMSSENLRGNRPQSR